VKKIAISLIALAALSTASLASERGHIPGSENYFDTYAAHSQVEATNANAFAVVKKAKSLSNFELLKKISREADDVRH
jgi:hypothetical protein